MGIVGKTKQWHLFKRKILKIMYVGNVIKNRRQLEEIYYRV